MSSTEHTLQKEIALRAHLAEKLGISSLAVWRHPDENEDGLCTSEEIIKALYIACKKTMPDLMQPLGAKSRQNVEQLLKPRSFATFERVANALAPFLEEAKKAGDVDPHTLLPRIFPYLSAAQNRKLCEIVLDNASTSNDHTYALRHKNRSGWLETSEYIKVKAILTAHGIASFADMMAYTKIYVPNPPNDQQSVLPYALAAYAHRTYRNIDLDHYVRHDIVDRRITANNLEKQNKSDYRGYNKWDDIAKSFGFATKEEMREVARPLVSLDYHALRAGMFWLMQKHRTKPYSFLERDDSRFPCLPLGKARQLEGFLKVSVKRYTKTNGETHTAKFPSTWTLEQPAKAMGCEDIFMLEKIGYCVLAGREEEIKHESGKYTVACEKEAMNIIRREASGNNSFWQRLGVSPADANSMLH